jgi:hypothetical protein
MFRLAFEDELRQVVHTLRIEDAIKVIAFVLHYAGVEALGHALDRFAVEP